MAYHAAFRDTRTASVIIGRGDFRAYFVTAQLERLSLQGGNETLPRTVYSAVDPRQFAIGFPIHPRQEIHINGLEVVPGAIVVFRGASEGHIVLLQPVDGGPSLCRMRILRLPGGP